MKKREKRSKRTHRWAFPLGLLIIALAVVGTVTVVSAVVGKVRDATDKTELRAEYEAFLEPIIMNDPSPFDDIEQANMTELLDMTIWSLLEDSASPNDYEFSSGDTPGLIVPQSDVEMQFEKLFGKDILPIHTDVTGTNYTFAYDSVNQNYIIPITGVMPAYTPSVVDIDTKGSAVILTVGYLAGQDWARDTQGNYVKPEPSKYMKITLRTSGDTYYLASIQATETTEIVTGETRAPETLPSSDNEITVATTAETTTEAPVTDEDGNPVTTTAETPTDEDGNPVTTTAETPTDEDGDPITTDEDE